MKKLVIALGAGVLCLAAPAFADREHMEKKVDHFMKKMDTDGNGSISKAEHDDFATSMFGEADANSDGSLSRQEILDHKKKEKDEMKKAGVIDDKKDGKNDNQAESKAREDR